MQSNLTTSRKRPVLARNRKKARELRGLRRELVAEWREVMETLRLIIQTLEGK